MTKRNRTLVCERKADPLKYVFKTHTPSPYTKPISQRHFQALRVFLGGVWRVFFIFKHKSLRTGHHAMWCWPCPLLSYDIRGLEAVCRRAWFMVTLQLICAGHAAMCHCCMASFCALPIISLQFGFCVTQNSLSRLKGHLLLLGTCISNRICFHSNENLPCKRSEKLFSCFLYIFNS